jgi:peptide/nickel transport system permease protein
MAIYLLRRLLLLPSTLLVILLVNFVILNLAPNDPSTISSAAATAEGVREAGREGEYERDDQYLIFREHYGLTLPILFNGWSWGSRKEILRTLTLIVERKRPGAATEIPASSYKQMRVAFGDRARFIMPQLLDIASDDQLSDPIRQAAVRFFGRGGTRMGFVGAHLTADQRHYNRQVADNNAYLRSLLLANGPLAATVGALQEWYAHNRVLYRFEPTRGEKIWNAFFETRLSLYLKRMLTLDFGTLRSDHNRGVVTEVGKRLKYSLVMTFLPMLFTFVLCQLFGSLMACKQRRWPDHTLNVTFLILYAVPVFVVAPFLIEKIALPYGLPVGGFRSDDALYSQFTSWQRLCDILRHLSLPLIAVTYGTLAVESRLSRTAVLEVMRQDYVRTARAKGLPPFTVLWKHVGRNASITVVTALATSLGAILSGSLIVETIFGIDGFGRFFYEAIVNRDYNVILFSTLTGSLLALTGYLLADLAYTLLDPRVSLH